MDFASVVAAIGGGAVVAAIIAAVNAQVVLVAGRRDDHARTLWERQVQLYDDILREASGWQRVRDTETNPAPVTREDQDRADETRIRFQMFGDSEIRQRYLDHLDRHWRWVGLIRSQRDVIQWNKEVMAGERHPNDETSDEEILRLMAAVKDARREADQARAALFAEVGKTVRDVPKLNRRQVISSPTRRPKPWHLNRISTRWSWRRRPKIDPGT